MPSWFLVIISCSSYRTHAWQIFWIFTNIFWLLISGFDLINLKLTLMSNFISAWVPIKERTHNCKTKQKVAQKHKFDRHTIKQWLSVENGSLSPKRIIVKLGTLKIPNSISSLPLFFEETGQATTYQGDVILHAV